MALVMLALNGEGLGHLIRCTIVCDALKSVGEKPIIFSQGLYQPHGASHFPAKNIPSLWRAPEDVRKRVASELYTMAAISLPAIVVEDTHPNPIRLSPEVRRVLMVRPTSFEYLRSLRQRQSNVYAAFVLCDAPDSPTWPYTPDETKEVIGWDNWHVVGPIYRRATASDIDEVLRRYSLSADEDLCVFTMGGGGVHEVNDRDVERFMALATEVADRIQQGPRPVRLIFVKGPYFPPDVTVPDFFETVQHEPQMPALLSVARGAVIRAGFNTTWECLAAGTPFVPLVGTTVAEPVPERVSKLQALGLLPDSIDKFWFEDRWRDDFRRLRAEIVVRHPGTPRGLELQRLIVGEPSSPTVVARAYAARSPGQRTQPARSPFAGLLGWGRKPLPLTIRIDDVTAPEPTMTWLLDLLASRGMRASLEVVPYLAGFDETLLDQYDVGLTLFEVSQHGYAHVPRSETGGRRYEFAPGSIEPTQHELAVIGQGRRQLMAAFPRRFTGGFSPPFDALPAWLPAAWQAEGGQFVSCLYTNHIEGAPLPVVRAGIDVWNWSEDRAVPRHRIRRMLDDQALSDGHIGIVLHPRCLRSNWEKARLLSILNFVQKRGVVSTSLRELAASRAAARTTRPMGPGGRLMSLLAGNTPRE